MEYIYTSTLKSYYQRCNGMFIFNSLLWINIQSHLRCGFNDIRYFLPKNKLELKCFCCWQRSAAFEFSTIYAWFQSKLMIKLERGHQGPKCISRWQSSTSKNASLIFVFFNCNTANKYFKD